MSNSALEVAMDAVLSDADITEADRVDRQGVVAPARRHMALPYVGQAAEQPQRWLTTFADLVALLVAFFVMILSMSAFEPDAVARLNGLPAGAAGAEREAVPSGGEGRALVQSGDTEYDAGAHYLGGLLLAQSQVLGVSGVTLERKDGGVVLTLPATVLGSDSISLEVAAVLDRIAGAAPGRVSIFGAAPIGDAASLYEASLFARLDAEKIATGAAGWVVPGTVVVAIQDGPSAPNGGRTQ